MPLFSSFVSGSTKSLGAVSSSWRNFSVVTGGTLTSDATYYYRTFTDSGAFVIYNKPLTELQFSILGGGGGGGALSSSSSTVPTAGSGGGGSPITNYSTFSDFPPIYCTVLIGAGGPGGSVSHGYEGISSQVYNNSVFLSVVSGRGGAGLGGLPGSVSSSAGGPSLDLGGGTHAPGGSGSGRSAGGGGGAAGAGFGYFGDSQSGGLGSASSTIFGYANNVGCGGGGGGYTAGGASGSTGIGGYNTAFATPGGNGGIGGNGGGGCGATNDRTGFLSVGGSGGKGIAVFRYLRSDVGG